MHLRDFIDKAIVQGHKYVSNVDKQKEQVNIFFDDGTRTCFSFDDWFYLLETSLQIISINEQLCSEI